MNSGERQRKLSLKAEREPNHRFDDLYGLLHDRDWLLLAHDYVAQNAGSVTAGCDGITMARFDEHLESNLQQLAKDLRFKRPVDANFLDNYVTLCIDCHRKKTESDRIRESRMR
jgi:retron-type reverse transcriptase